MKRSKILRMYNKSIFSGGEDFALFDKDADGLISLSEWIEKSALAGTESPVTSERESLFIQGKQT